MNEKINFSREIKTNYNLQKKHNYKKKTGNAAGYYQLVFDETLEKDLLALHQLYKSDKPFKIFGLHTNLYITDSGYEGLFMDVDPKNSKITFNKETEEFTVTSNLVLSKFVNYTKNLGYDFTALAGIPGVIGGGVVGNSSYYEPFSNFIKKIVVYDFEIGEFKVFVPDDNFFSDRDSLIKQANKTKTRYFVKDVVLKANYLGREKVNALYNAQIESRKEALKISFTEGTAGSIFSNLHIAKSLGKLMKGLLLENPSINIDFNGATFSPNGNMHFKTEYNTTDKDVASFFQHVLKQVKEIYGIDLHQEVMILDSDGAIDIETFIKRNSK